MGACAGAGAGAWGHGGGGGSIALSRWLSLQVRGAIHRLLLPPLLHFAQALQFLLGMLSGLELGSVGAAASPRLRTWLDCLALALPTVTRGALPAFQSVVLGFVWQAAGQPQCLLKLLQTLLAMDQVSSDGQCRLQP